MFIEEDLEKALSHFKNTIDRISLGHCPKCFLNSAIYSKKTSEFLFCLSCKRDAWNGKNNNVRRIIEEVSKNAKKISATRANKSISKIIGELEKM